MPHYCAGYRLRCACNTLPAMKYLMARMLVASFALALSGAAAADIRIEPDDFGGDLTHAVPGATLSLALPDGTVRPDFFIISSNPYSGTPSTGVRVFGLASDSGEGPLFDYAGGNLRVDFDVTIHAVAIDFIGCCDVPGDPQTQGLLRAFSSSGVLLASEITAVLPRGVAVRATVTSGLPIAYVLASAAEGANGTYLDNFVASTVPAPPAAWLLAAGLMLVAAVTRRGGDRR